MRFVQYFFHCLFLKNIPYIFDLTIYFSLRFRSFFNKSGDIFSFLRMFFVTLPLKNTITMIAILSKEIRYFFTSSIGYTTMAVYLLCNSLFLWIFSGNYNIFDSGFCDLSPFFVLSSWIFIFLVPAMTMRLISEEKRTGMLQFLLTHPLRPHQIILGKFFGVIFLLFCLLLLSLTYVYILRQISYPVSSPDYGVLFGSYLSLFLLSCTFASIGIWSSCITGNQIVAFSISTFINFVLFFGIDELISLFFSTDISFGLKAHFDQISRGVLDSRNIVYFFVIICLFLYSSVLSIKGERL